MKKILIALNKVQTDLCAVGIGKDSDAGYGNTRYKFRGIDAVYNVLSPLLAKHKVVILPTITNRSVVEKTNTKGSAMFYTVLDITYTFYSAEDESSVECKVIGEAMDTGDKSTNKAMSIAYKYACFQVFAIPTEGDNDPDATIHDVKATNNVAPTKSIDTVKPIARINACLDLKSLHDTFKELWIASTDDDYRSAIKQAYDAKKQEMEKAA